MTSYDLTILNAFFNIMNTNMLLFQVTVPDSDIYGVTLAVGEKRWLPFTIEIPPNIVSPMVVSNKKERAIAMVKYTVVANRDLFPTFM